MSVPGIKGKVVLITGGSKGIGAATVRAFVASGAHVTFTFGSDKETAAKLVEELGPKNVDAQHSDAGNVAAMDELINAVLHKWGQLDVLVPCAGIMPMKDLENVTEKDFDSIFAVNVKGPMFLAQKAAKHMKAGSSVVFISTGVNDWTSIPPNYMLYVATKGAIDQMTRAISKDLGAKGINVNSIAPGPTATELFFKGKPDQVIKHIEGLSPFQRLGKPEEIANAIVFMASPAASWVAGQKLNVNGANMV